MKKTKFSYIKKYQTNADFIGIMNSRKLYAPMPINNVGIGQFIDTVGAWNGAYSLPLGGTWMYHIMRIRRNMGTTSPISTTFSGVAAGGTLINTGATDLISMGWIWRIA